MLKVFRTQMKSSRSQITVKKNPNYKIETVISKHDFVFRLKMLRFKTLVATLVRQQMLLEKLKKTIMSTFWVSVIR